MGIYVGDKRYALLVGSTRRKVMGKEPLPYDAEIEYLEADGTQWLSTGVTAKNGIDVIIDCLYTYSPSNAKVMVGPSPNGGWWAGSINGHWGVAGRPDNNPSSLVRHIVSVNYNTQTQLYVDGVLYQQQNRSGTVANPIALFNAYNSSFKSNARLYSAIIKDGDTVVFDAIPVRVGQTGYMYDRISGTLFGNSGTGDFILGNDKN